ncbi:42513_t:CDS:2 [Gigaspora margarita]|uniref:42513_t:CDS:1 n=1 Tax=Gigaspora margarita TaxID=4874 RepID=A0ABN7WA88_GIGMA|nr:42513_t:CDS:2 [Gigaspora margarita]
MQEHLKLMLELEDPNIVVDLGTNNGFKESKFGIFWSELQAYFNELVDDRCHEPILYLPWFISFAILYREFVCFISADDKHKLPIGEKVLISTNVPDNISDSFYSGDVYVGYENTIFESSNAICHATKFFQTISLKFSNKIPPILCLYTDGGPDHRTNFGSVQISLISLFFKGDFDMIIAMKTAPYHSWANPAERIMSILKLRLQNISLACNEFSLEQEKIFKQLDTIEAI